jgi:predicted transcriptional regulator of viral defense system
MRPKETAAPGGDDVIARIAGRQHGVVARRQLTEAGISTASIRGRLEKGGLIRVHRGVYRVGHAAPISDATYLGAVMACGTGALLSGRAAAFLHRLIKGSPPPPEVSAPRELRSLLPAS